MDRNYPSYFDRNNCDNYNTCVQSCTMSLSVAKNNNNASQKTEQTTTSSVDSTHININPKDY